MSSSPSSGWSSRPTLISTTWTMVTHGVSTARSASRAVSFPATIFGVGRKAAMFASRLRSWAQARLSTPTRDCMSTNRHFSLKTDPMMSKMTNRAPILQAGRIPSRRYPSHKPLKFAQLQGRSTFSILLKLLRLRLQLYQRNHQHPLSFNHWHSHQLWPRNNTHTNLFPKLSLNPSLSPSLNLRHFRFIIPLLRTQCRMVQHLGLFPLQLPLPTSYQHLLLKLPHQLLPPPPPPRLPLHHSSHQDRCCPPHPYR